MKKLWGHSRQKNSKASLLPPEVGSSNPAHLAEKRDTLSQDQPHTAILPPIHQHNLYAQQQPQTPATPLSPPQQQPNINAAQGLASPTPRPVRRSPTATTEEDRWEVVSSNGDPQIRSFYQPSTGLSRNSSYASLPPGASPPAVTNPNGPRSPSPYTAPGVQAVKGISPPRDREYTQPPHPQQAGLRKRPTPTPPVALGILRALDPPRPDASPKPSYDERVMSNYSDTGHRERDLPEKKDKWTFWKADKDKDMARQKQIERDRGRDGLRSSDGQNELTRMIGFLTATASEDWGLVLEVCERASASEIYAKEAVRALRREFKYGEPGAQLSAARLWAVMLRNSSELFVTQSTTRKFLDTLEDLLNNHRTSPVVRERVLDVIAAAAYASGSKRDTGFRGLWRRVKPADKPDEGVPLDNDDAMLNPPLSATQPYDSPTPPADHPPTMQKRTKSPTRNRIIPREEDIRRLFQECKLGQGNAALLSQAVALSRPEDLKKNGVIKEFYAKCRASQELIFAQIPWASSGAEQSRAAKNQEVIAGGGILEDIPLEQTTEEKLLEALLAANTELVDSLQQHDDMQRVALERQTEDRSRKETKMDWRYKHHSQFESDAQPSDHYSRESSSSSPSRSNSPPASTYAPHSYTEVNTLAPPPPAPHGPRLPTQTTVHSYSRSRTPSPAGAALDHHHSRWTEDVHGLQDGMQSLQISHDLHRRQSYDSHAQPKDVVTEANEEDLPPMKPSAKALGKRKVIEEDPSEGNAGDGDDHSVERDGFHMDGEHSIGSPDIADTWHHRPVQYVYDAVAERTKERIREGQVLQAQARTQAQAHLVNGIHS